METQTNQAREKKPKVFEKGFSKAVIAKLGLLWKLSDIAHCISNNTGTLQLFGKTACGLHVTWAPLKCERQKNKERGENKKNIRKQLDSVTVSLL